LNGDEKVVFMETERMHTHEFDYMFNKMYVRKHLVKYIDEDEFGYRNCKISDHLGEKFIKERMQAVDDSDNLK